MDYDCFTLGCRFFLATLMLVMYLLKKVPVETFNTSFESTKNKKQYGTKITCTEARKKKIVVIKKKKCYNF